MRLLCISIQHSQRRRSDPQDCPVGHSPKSPAPTCSLVAGISSLIDITMDGGLYVYTIYVLHIYNYIYVYIMCVCVCTQMYPVKVTLFPYFSQSLGESKRVSQMKGGVAEQTAQKFSLIWISLGRLPSWRAFGHFITPDKPSKTHDGCLYDRPTQQQEILDDFGLLAIC